MIYASDMHLLKDDCSTRRVVLIRFVTDALQREFQVRIVSAWTNVKLANLVIHHCTSFSQNTLLRGTVFLNDQGTTFGLTETLCEAILE